MKQCQDESKSLASHESCAREILDVVPAMMRSIRQEVRRHYKKDLSIPQFRSLAFLTHYPEASLSDLSEHLGLTLPSTSKIIDALVSRELVKREDSPDDRRRVRLTVTKGGKTVFDAARIAAQDHLAKQLAQLPEADLALVTKAMQLLRPAFLTPNGAQPDKRNQ